jgi:hypothetical protein
MCNVDRWMAASNEDMAQEAVETHLKCWQGICLARQREARRSYTVVAVADSLLVDGELVSTFIGEYMCCVLLIKRQIFLALDVQMLTRFSSRSFLGLNLVC